MDRTMTAVEVTGTIDENGQLQLDHSLPVSEPRRVRIIVLYPPDDKIEESEWLRAAARNPVFRYLSEAEEDIYTLEDGQPFDDAA